MKQVSNGKDPVMGVSRLLFKRRGWSLRPHPSDLGKHHAGKTRHPLS